MLNKKALAGTPSTPPAFVEDVFSTYLYSGTGSSQTITNGIDLSGKGGLVWGKRRNAANSHFLIDTVRGAGNRLESDGTGAQTDSSAQFPSFNSNGFTVATADNEYNNSAGTFCSWTFRKQAKFFDVVTYTGNGSGSGQTINHNLGSVPGCIIVKRTDTTGNWAVYHRSLTSANYSLLLNLTGAQDLTDYFLSTPTSTTFQVGSNSVVNASGGTYVAYLFAHDAGGFGTAGTDNVISCGSYNRTDGVKSVVNLGFEPQFIIQKTATAGSQWTMLDIMRGWTGASNSNLFANLSNAETTGNIGIMPTATGFEDYTTAGATDTIIYIAIRRGPMKTPTSGTSVFSPNSVNGSTGQVVTTNFSVDSQIWNYTNGTSLNSHVYDRLRGISSTTTESGQGLVTSSTAAEVTDGYVRGWNNTGFQVPAGINGAPVVYYNFVRAPGFMDVVCYAGLRAINNTTPQAVSHNLGVAPELVIVKCRSAATVSSTATNWSVCTILNGAYSNSGYLNTTDSFGFSNNLDPSNGGSVSASNITFGYGDATTNASGQTYVAYLFATLAGVSKVGSYTGTAAAQTINCGFTAGARFVMIKRTDSTGDWYVWDSARGIVSGNDPYLLLNSTAAEVTNTDYIDPVNSGFELSSTAPAAINANGGSFIFMAIA